jgi:hypothetical protein
MDSYVERLGKAADAAELDVVLVSIAVSLSENKKEVEESVSAPLVAKLQDISNTPSLACNATIRRRLKRTLALLQPAEAVLQHLPRDPALRQCQSTTTTATLTLTNEAGTS